MLINHVMSNDVYSGIFESILKYFQKYSSTDINYIVTQKPISNADIYHYHRPNLENELLPNSVTTVHHDLADTDSSLSLETFTERYKEAARVICLNSGQIARLNEIGIKNTVLIPHGYRSDIFSPRTKPKKPDDTKITLGIISKRYGRKVKGEAYLYELSRHLNPRKVNFLMVGEGRAEDAKFLRKFGFEVKIYERLPYRMFSNLYYELDALLMLSYYEGGPANIPEAIASATPILGFNVGMVPDIVRHDIEGKILTGDIDDDANTLNEITENREWFQKKNNEMITKNSISRAITWEQSIYRNTRIYRNTSEHKEIRKGSR